MSRKFLISAIFVLQYAAVLNAQDSLRCGFGRESFSPSYTGWYKHAVTTLDHSSKRGKPEPDTIYVIPVVFHYIQQSFIIDYQLMHDHIALLNADFRRRNADTSELRQIFRSRAGDARIEFVLADSTPDGQPSQGYTRTRNSLTFGIDKGTPYSESHRMKFDSTGGIQPWDTRKYLNIWICDLTTPKGHKYVAGFATPPFNSPNWSPQFYGDSLIDGVVIDQATWLQSGRNSTITHEIGHYFGLRHVSGDPPALSVGACKYDDSIYDTPRVNGQNFFHCDKTTNSCIETVDDMPDMLENFMDYTGNCRNSFTRGQVDLMRFFLRTLRKDLFKMSIVQPVEPYREKELRIIAYSNSMQNKLYVEFTDSFSVGYHLEMYDMLGKQLLKQDLAGLSSEIDMEAITSGLYFIAIKNTAGDVVFDKRILK